MKKALNAFLLFAAMLVAIPCSTGCAWWAENKGDVKTVVQTVDDVAQSLCGVFYGDKMNISVQDAVKTFCNAREKYEPWIDQVLAGAKAGGDIKLGVKPVVPVPAAVQAPAPLPVPVTELGSRAMPHGLRALENARMRRRGSSVRQVRRASDDVFGVDNVRSMVSAGRDGEKSIAQPSMPSDESCIYVQSTRRGMLLLTLTA